MLTKKDVVWLEKLEKILESQDIRPDADSLLTIYSGVQEIIKNDSNLKYIYDDESFIFKIDNKEYKLSSQIAATLILFEESMSIKSSILIKLDNME